MCWLLNSEHTKKTSPEEVKKKKWKEDNLENLEEILEESPRELENNSHF